MDNTEKISIIKETIQAIDKYTMMKAEDMGRILETPEDINSWESWEASDLKDKLYTQLGKLEYENQPNIVTE